MLLPGLRVLIVDSDPSNAKLFELILASEGADARTASNAESARALFGQLRPRLVLMEIWLPDTNGLDLARELRNADAAVAILVVTSVNGPEARARVLASGADEYIQKPVDPNALVASIERLVSTGGNKP